MDEIMSTQEKRLHGGNIGKIESASNPAPNTESYTSTKLSIKKGNDMFHQNPLKHTLQNLSQISLEEVNNITAVIVDAAMECLLRDEDHTRLLLANLANHNDMKYSSILPTNLSDNLSKIQAINNQSALPLSTEKISDIHSFWNQAELELLQLEENRRLQLLQDVRTLQLSRFPVA